MRAKFSFEGQKSDTVVNNADENADGEAFSTST